MSQIQLGWAHSTEFLTNSFHPLKLNIMKKYALAVMILLCSILSVNAAVINGFSQKKQQLKKEINKAVELLNATSSEKTKKQIEKQLKRLRKESEIISTKYTQTAELLSTFEFIDPELFAKVSQVTNAEGTLTHVYVRYVNRSSEEFTYYTRNHFPAKAYTCVKQSPDNQNVCASFYGTNTITITIGIGCDEKLVLGHEFAHVLYIVPNLSEYTYFMKYQNKKVNTTSHGHNPNDPSFAFLKAVEDRFATRYNDYKMKYEEPLNQSIASKNEIQ